MSKVMSTRHALTTVDNPFDPFDQFDEWLEWDQAAGYNTSDYLGRIVIYSDDLSIADQSAAVSNAIDEIIEQHGGELYKKVSQQFVDQYNVD